MLRDEFSGSEMFPQSGVKVLQAFILVGASEAKVCGGAGEVGRVSFLLDGEALKRYRLFCSQNN